MIHHNKSICYTPIIMNSIRQSRYSQRGVSSSKRDVHNSIKNTSRGLYPNSFCKIIPDYLGGNRDHYCNIMHTDGAGTKSSLAYMYWRETGDLSVWRDVAHDAVIMNVDDLICVGAIDNILLSSTIGRNKHIIPEEVLRELINGTEDTLKMLNTFGINIFSAGGETADLGDVVKTVLVDSTVSCRMKLSNVIKMNIQPDDVIVGLSSYGQASYEEKYNSGIGSNGLSSARHDVLSDIYRKKYPETYDLLTPSHLIYCGKHLVTDSYLHDNMTIGQLLLSPTRTYAPIIKEIIESLNVKNINGIIHCTGGGQTKVLHFVDNVQIIKNNMFEVPLIMKLIQQNSDTDWYEMYRVFNMGHRMELYLNKDVAQRAIDISKSYGVDARIIGYVKENKKTQLSIQSQYGSFTYYKN